MRKAIFILLIFTLTNCSVKFADKIAEKGSNQELSNNYNRAMHFYTKAIRLNKNSALAYWRRGNLYSTEAFSFNYSKAISDLSRAIQIDSTLNEGYCYWDRAFCKEMINDTIGALSDYNSAILIDPEKENFYYFRGALKYYRFHDLTGAMSDLDNAIKFWDEYDLARLLRAELKVNLHEYIGAMDDYNKLRSPLRDFDSSYAHKFYYRGIAKYNTGDTTGGCNDLNIALKLGFSWANDKLREFCE